MPYTPNPTDDTQPVESVFAETAAAEFRSLKAYIKGQLPFALKLPIGFPGTYQYLPTPEAGKYLGWSADQTRLINLTGSGGSLPTDISFIASIAALRLLDSLTQSLAFVTGYYSTGDGGGGTYRFDAADVTTADNGGSVIVAVDGGRWKLPESDDWSVKQFGAKGDGVTDDTAECQAAIDASYGKKVIFPSGRYLLTAPLVIQPLFGGTSQLPLTLQGDGFNANGGIGAGSTLLIQHTGNGIELINATAENSDALFIIEKLCMVGDGADANGGHGIYAQKVSNLHVKDLFISDMRDTGIYYQRCYGSSVRDTTLLRNRKWGFYGDRAFNIGVLRHVRAYSNGRIYSTDVVGNIRLYGGGDPNLGTTLDNVDASYAGTSAFKLYQRSDNSLTNITVAAGVATVTTLAAHGRTTGQFVAVTGATVAPNLNTVYPVAITSTGANTYTFATSAANGVYTEATLIIGPNAYGLFLDGARGLSVHGYCEDCIGPGLYIGADVASFEVNGGYWQGTALSCVIINDSAYNGKYANMVLNGPRAQLVVNVVAGQHNVDVSSSVTFLSGASVILPTMFLCDGQWSSPSVPTGTWTAEYVKRSAPVVGQPKGWYRTAPAVWTSEGNL